MPIRPYLSGGTFEPEDIDMMSRAFERLCKVLAIEPDAEREREGVAARVIELTRDGQRNLTRLVETILNERQTFARYGRRSFPAI
jgi:hypothetical protein